MNLVTNILKIKKKIKGGLFILKLMHQNIKDWYSWIHFTKNKIEFKTNIKKYNWQKPHSENKTGTSKAYHPNKKNNDIKKKYNSWKS